MNDPTKKPPLITRFIAWVRRHPTKTYLISGGIIIILAATIAVAILTQKPAAVPAPSAPAVQPKAEPVVYYSPLTGKKVKTEAATKQAVTAIMLENSPDARPQSGLKEAGVVYEAVAEGGITRFLAFYQQEKPKLIGPVRSLRAYYVSWLTPYNASVAHIGGSAGALKTVRNGKYRDIDQFFNPGAYWRSTDRYAPHNVYTNFKRLDALNKAKKYTTSKFTGMNRIDEQPATKPTATRVTINISGPLYNTSYAYDKKHNYYKRYLAGEAHRDREKGHITPKVVVAMRVDMHRVFEDGYRESIKTVGKGSAVIFQNGTATKVTWHKKSHKDQLRFTKDGKDVPLVRGQTWITAVPGGGGVSWR